MSIKGKLILALALLGAVILSLSVTGFLTLGYIQERMGSIVAERVMPLQQLKRIADAYAVAIVDNAHKARSGAFTWSESVANQDGAMGVIAEEWQAYLKNPHIPQEAELIARARSAMADADAPLARLREILDGRNLSALERFIEQDLYPTIDPISNEISALVDLQAAIAVDIYASARQTLSAIIGGMLVIGVITLGVIAFAAMVVLKTVGSRLVAMETALVAVAAGQFETQIPSAGDRDEIGRIATAAETFRQNGMRVAQMTEAEQARALADVAQRRRMMGELRDAFGQVIDASVRGDFSRRVDASFPDEELNSLAESVNRLVTTVDRGLAETGRVLGALAETNLTQRVTGQYEGAFEALKRDVNMVADRLSDIVHQLQHTSGSVRVATGEILAGANDLAERTTRQAAALEETSAAMEQLARTVDENAERAQQANAQSSEVRTSAEAAAAVISEANVAMQQISDSSNRISSIIGLIDDIAFQTNLLALNASVEAARAGEAGKGFAVVAVEVRRLAQSAAEASADVKALIEQSATLVGGGTKLVADATGRIETMMSSLRRNAGLVDAIASASRSQSDSISEVSSAIRQMDEMTQHNAALVEETNAAIEQTEAQAAELDRIVEMFVIDGDRAAVQHRRPAARRAA